MSTLVLILILFFLILFSATLSGTETAYFSISSYTRRSFSEDKDKRKRLVAKLLDSPRDLLVTIMMLNVFSNILIQNTVSSIFGKFSSFFVKVGFPLVLVLLFGEIIPKSIAFPNNTKIARFMAPFINFIKRFVKPFRILLTKATTYISRMVFFFLKKEKPLSIKELNHILDEGEETGIILEEESELISGFLDLHESNVKEKMSPKDSIYYYNVEDPIENLINLFVEKKCSKIPVCRDSLENVLGIISANDFFINQENLKDFKDLEKIIKKPFFIPETTKCWSLLKKLRDTNREISLVVDEYGSISGLITQEDLIESITGDIKNIEEENLLFTRASKDVIIAAGIMPLEDFKNVFDVEIESRTNAVTISGYLLEKFEDIPMAGTKYKTKNFLFYILASDPNRIRRVYIRKLK